MNALKSIAPLMLALILAASLAILATTPPRPLGESAPPTRFSAERAMRDVERIAREPHASGSLALAGLRRYLAARLSELGLEVREQSGSFPEEARATLNARSGEDRASIPLVNIIGVLPGTDRTLPALALMAHYDGVYGSPAAADDGAGVASILEVLRALRSEGPRRRDVIVVLTDGEEAGLNGAHLFFDAAPEAARIAAIVNLEARGGGGRANLFQTSAGNGEIARLWSETAPHPAGTSLATFIYSVLPNDTDLTVALPGGMVAWNFAFIGRSGLYHSPLASAEALDRGSLQQMGEQTLGLARSLVTSQALPEAAPDIVFFDVYGLFAVHYPVWFGWVMLAIGFVGYALPLVRARGLRAFAGGAGTTLALLAGVAGALYLLNLLSGADAPVNYYDRLAAIPRLQAIALCVAVAGVLLASLRSRPGPWAEAGRVSPVFVAALAFQSLAPVAAYVLTIPLALGGAVALARACGLSGVMYWPAALVAGLVGGYALFFGFLLMQAVGPTMPMSVVLPLAMVVIAFAPFDVSRHRAPRALLAGGLIALAVGLAMWIRLDPLAQSVAVYSEQRAAIVRH